MTPLTTHGRPLALALILAAGLQLAGLSTAWSAPPAAIPSHIPFVPGERLTFEVRWLFVPAGTATLEVLPLEIRDGEPVWHFVITIRTNKFADAFYKVRDRIEAYTDRNMTRTLHYKKRQREGDTKRDVQVLFDWEANRAVYEQDGKRNKPLDIEPGSFDPLSIFYYFRSQKLAIGQDLAGYVTDGKKCVKGVARVVKKQAISAPHGRYDCFLVEPSLEHIGGVFKESEDAVLRIWVSQGPEKRVVRIKSKVVVGSFTADLTAVEKIESPAQAVLPSGE